MNIETGRQDWKTPVAAGNRASGSKVKPSWRPRAAALRLRVYSYLVTLDVACITLGFAVATVTRPLFNMEAVPNDSNWLYSLAITLPLYLIAAINVRGYANESLADPFLAIRRALQSLAFAVGSLILIAFALKTSATFPRLVTVLGSVYAVVLLVGARYFFVRHIERIIGGSPFSVILISDGDQPIPPGKFSVMVAAEAYFDPETHDPVMYDRLAKTLEGADRVVVACAPERRMAWAHALKGANIQGEIVVPELAALAPLAIASHGSAPTVVVANGPLRLADRFVKRAFDVTLAGGALLLLSPLLALVALAVKLDSRGPMLFKQTRIGRSNQMFKVLKFRSMRVEQADGAGHRSASRDDDRITRVGRIIRSTSIDELPQLLNVLRGDMSIVGPRPHALGSRAADKLFWEVDRRYWHRHACKPGLTGLAQVRGFRGATMVEADLKNRLQADLEYLENWSIWRDAKIIVLTFRVLLHRNAF